MIQPDKEGDRNHEVQSSKNHAESMEALPGERAWLSAKAEAINAKRIEEAKATAGVKEETNTWNGWKQLGYEVIHGSKALFGTELIWGSRGDGKAYKARFFGRSQVHEIAIA